MKRWIAKHNTRGQYVLILCKLGRTNGKIQNGEMRKARMMKRSKTSFFGFFKESLKSDQIKKKKKIVFKNWK